MKEGRKGDEKGRGNLAPRSFLKVGAYGCKCGCVCVCMSACVPGVTSVDIVAYKEFLLPPIVASVVVYYQVYRTVGYLIVGVVCTTYKLQQ